MSATVVRLDSPKGQLLTKKQLAAELGRSERWIELRQRDGLPVADTDRFGRRRYRLSDVQAWLHETSHKPRSTQDRIAELEQRVATLAATVERLERRAG